MTSMDAEPMLTAAEESRLVGKSFSAVSRARQDPGHPMNGLTGGTRAGGPWPSRPTAPRAAILEFWSTRKPGPKRTQHAEENADA